MLARVEQAFTNALTKLRAIPRNIARAAVTPSYKANSFQNVGRGKIAIGGRTPANTFKPAPTPTWTRGAPRKFFHTTTARLATVETHTQHAATVKDHYEHIIETLKKHNISLTKGQLDLLLGNKLANEILNIRHILHILQHNGHGLNKAHVDDLLQLAPEHLNIVSDILISNNTSVEPNPEAVLSILANNRETIMRIGHFVDKQTTLSAITQLVELVKSENKSPAFDMFKVTIKDMTPLREQLLSTSRLFSHIVGEIMRQPATISAQNPTSEDAKYASPGKGLS